MLLMFRGRRHFSEVLSYEWEECMSGRRQRRAGTWRNASEAGNCILVAGRLLLPILRRTCSEHGRYELAMLRFGLKAFVEVEWLLSGYDFKAGAPRC